MLKRFLTPLLLIAFVAACTVPPAPLTVESLTPADGATGVSVDVAISATFSRAIDAASIAGAFTLSDGTAAVAGVVTYNSATRIATFTPSAPLAYGTTHTATVAGTVGTDDGVTLGDDESWSFTTETANLIGDLTVDPATASLAIGDTVQLDAVFSGVVGSPDLGVTWSSDDETVATVDTDGLVTAIGAGTATITATSDFDGTLTDQAEITVWTELTASDYDPGAVLVDTALAPLAATVAGGAGTYTFALTAGALPAGVTLDADTGEIAGTPTEVGVGAAAFTGTVTASDGIQSVDLAFSIQVADVMTVSPSFAITEDAGTEVTIEIVVTGGLGPFTFEVTDPADPAYPEPYQLFVAPGLTLNADGTITGDLTTAGFWRSFVTTTDALGQTGETVLEVETDLVLLYTGAPYAYPLGCGGEVFPDSVACPAGGEPSGTVGSFSAITPAADVVVLGSGGGVLEFSFLRTDDANNSGWEIDLSSGMIYRSNEALVDGFANTDAIRNGDRTYTVTVLDFVTGETASATVVFNVDVP